MASEENSEDTFREYIEKHSLPQIFKALLGGLCTTCPENSLTFIEEKLLAIQSSRDRYKDWNTCIAEDVEEAEVDAPVEENLEESGKKEVEVLASKPDLPQHSPLHDMINIFGATNDDIRKFSFFEEACHFYQKNLMKMCFRAWKGFVVLSKWKKLQPRKMELVHKHYAKKLLRHSFVAWLKWLQWKKQRDRDAAKKLLNVYEEMRRRRMLRAWRLVVQETRKVEPPDFSEKDIISMLPSMLSIKIFEYLESGDLLRCAEVNDTWMAISNTHTLWNKINLSGEKHWIQSHDVQNILKKYRTFVVQLNLRGCLSMEWPVFQCISECRNLQDLNLSECTNINDDAVRTITENCQSLLYLNLSYTLVTNATLKVLARCCVYLQYLSLAQCRKFTDKGLQFLATERGCLGLLHLDLSGCSQITVNGFRHIAAGCSLLQHIVLDDMPTFTDKCLQELTAKCKSLVTISLLDASHLTDTAFETLAQRASLKQLRIEGNKHITDFGWRAICKGSPDLRHLHAANCLLMSDGSMKYIASLKNLTYLDISENTRVSDAGLRHLADGSCAAKLQELNVSHCRVNDIVAVRIVKRYEALQRLNISYCEGISSFDFLNSSSLVSLDISGCNIQDKGLSAVGEINCLQKLTMSECLGITDVGIEKFSKQARRLEDIDISHCVSLSDVSIKSLSSYCKPLARLIVAGCPKITDVGIHYLALFTPHLRELDVSGCVLLTDRSPRTLLKGCRSLHSLTMLYCRGISKRLALRLQPSLRHWEHSRDDAPYWYGSELQAQIQEQQQQRQQSSKERAKKKDTENEDSRRNNRPLPT
ncbi:F-box and leucine-rich repeat protein 13 isoform X2 [Engraulis encrasicolus]|uniref:F-box and leucine-rich repeat protein 13 isoform X2 n=1 Tax=Engraulis encrasicolus TaxID=184585 RepID=UPI002FD6DC39